MIKGKAAVFFGPGKPFALREITLPEIEPEAVLIRVTLANVCGSDLHFWRGDAPLRLPDDGWIFGHEMTGRVARLGAKVKTDSLGLPLAEGDRVAYTYFYPCGRCYACLNKEPASCPAKIERPRGHEDTVAGVAFSPDGKRFATASSDDTVKIWNVWGEEERTLIGHTAAVVAVSWSPDGKTIASGGNDQTIRLWDARTGKPVNVKKGQFLAPWDMKNVVAKIIGAGNPNVLVTERGVSFGYNTLVSDMRALPILAEMGAPVIFDATHSVQQPGGQGASSGGERRFVPVLGRAAVAVGVAGLFIETHQDPDRAPSDGPNMLPLSALEPLLKELIEIDRLTKRAHH